MAQNDYVYLSDPQKAAAIMVSLGADSASKVYKNLRESEIEQLTFEVARLDHLSAETIEQVMNDFYGLCLAQQVMTEGGLEYAREFIRKADYKNLMAIIQNEHPQTIALLLSYARADQASTIISELPNATKIDVVERIANMDRTSPEMIREVEKTLERKFSTIVSEDYTEVGGIDYIAEIMNGMDRNSEKYIFSELEKRDAKLTEEIRKRMFVFEDIAKMSSRDIQTALREIDTADLTKALKGSQPEVQDIFFANMSKRMSENVKTDMEYLVVRMREVEEAQQRIVAIFRRLEDEGKVVISKGGDDDIIV